MPDPGFGSASWISIKDSVAWADDPAGTPKYARLQEGGEEMENDQGVEPLESVYGGGSGGTRIVPNENNVSGRVEPEALYEGVPWVFCKHGFGLGSVATSGAGADKQHAY